VAAEVTYDYAIIRVVPRVERGEQVNVGVILSCVDAEFLESRIEADLSRLHALDPTLDLDAVRAGLELFPVVCAGGPDAGPIGELPPRGRFRWLVSPRSTVIQASPVHTGRSADPAATLQRLFDCLVRPIGNGR
jgi:mono/diheme cytochrome c family protein